jgi:hypothetical protein
MMVTLGGSRFQRWRDGTVHGRWQAVFDGAGTTGADGDIIMLRPRRSVSDTETHAGLVVSRSVYRDMRLDLSLRTAAQLRRPAPRSWEVAWVVWSYTDPGHFCYLVLKPNGWELGKRDPAYPGGQRFLATGLPEFAVRRWYRVEVVQVGAWVRIRVDGRVLVEYGDAERPYLSGRVGLYAEDAFAKFTSVTVTPY